MSEGGERPVWTTRAERGSLFAIRLVVGIYKIFGPRVVGILLYPIAAYFWLVAGPARRASQAYLERVRAFHGEDTVGSGRLWTFRHVHRFSEFILDRMCFWTGRYESFDVVVHGEEEVRALLAEGRGAMVLGAHLGSFDVLRVMAREEGVRVNVVMFTANAERIRHMLEALDPESSMRVIEVDPTSVRAAFEIKACVDRGEMVALLGDRVLPGGRGRVAHASFLGAPAPFPEGPFLIPILLRLPVVLGLAIKEGRRRYHLHLEVLSRGERVPPSERETVLRKRIEDFAGRLEHFVGVAPLQWFNFYDFWGGEADG